jgi:hypothetical protein
MKKVIDFSEICGKKVKELESQYRVIGTGSSRKVFDIDNKYVLKKSCHHTYGIIQTSFEVSLYNGTKSRRLCPVIYNNKDSIIAAKTIPLDTPYSELPSDVDHNKFKKFRKLLRDMKLIWEWYRYDDTKFLDLQVPNWKKIKSSKIYRDIEFLSCYDICMGDIWRESSWGYYHGYFVIIDYGLNNGDFHQYYCR